MFTGLISFLGGSVFRAIWGEASNWITKYQDNKHELAAMELQSKLDDKSHARELERLKTVSELGIKEIHVKSEAELQSKDADAFIIAQQSIFQKSGSIFVDAWNSSIRPLCATTALILWWLCLYNQNFNLTEWDKELVSVILGFYFAHRVYASRK